MLCLYVCSCAKGAMHIHRGVGYEPIHPCAATYMRLLLRVGIKCCGRVVDKFGLRTWIFGFTCLVFKSTCIDRRIPLREGAFFFTGMVLFPPLNKRNTRDRAKGLCIASERYIGV